MSAIGKKVKKHSGKPFKSSLKVNTVKDVTVNPHTQIPAYRFVEDDSIVDLRTVRFATDAEIQMLDKQVLGLDQSCEKAEEGFQIYLGIHRLCEEKIRVQAYRRWEAAGRPHGRDVEFWTGAEQDILGYTVWEANVQIHRHFEEHPEAKLITSLL